MHNIIQTTKVFRCNPSSQQEKDLIGAPLAQSHGPSCPNALMIWFKQILHFLDVFDKHQINKSGSKESLEMSFPMLFSSPHPKKNHLIFHLIFRRSSDFRINDRLSQWHLRWGTTSCGKSIGFGPWCSCSVFSAKCFTPFTTCRGKWKWTVVNFWTAVT